MNPGFSNYESKGEQLKDPVHIVTLLRRLKDAHTLLTVIVDGAKGQFSSVLVDVDSRQGFLLLDELNTKLGHDQLLKSARMRVIGQLQGVRLRFDADLESVIDQAEGSTYRVALPQTLYYLQRRAHFRVDLGRISTAIPIAVSLPDGGTLRGFLRDVSAGGLRARFRLGKGHSPELNVGDELPAAVLELAEYERFECRLEVRFAGYNEGTRELVLGCRFIDLEPPQRKRIEHLVMALQREQLRASNRMTTGR